MADKIEKPKLEVVTERQLPGVKNADKTNSGGEQAPLAGITSITVGNPAHPSAFVVDQSHLEGGGEAEIAIKKPAAFSLDKFKSKSTPTIGGVETLPTPLPVHNIAGAKDFVRLHPDDAYWSPELCFVNVPIKGVKQDTLHLIDEDIAMRYLPGGRIQRFRLVLATKPHDVFFLCIVPTQNLDNNWNVSNLMACEQAKTRWLQATSRKGEGAEGYKLGYAIDEEAFPATRWPKQPLSEWIRITYTGRMIETDDHPGLLRLIGAAQRIT